MSAFDHCDHDPIISLDVDNVGTIVAVTEYLICGSATCGLCKRRTAIMYRAHVVTAFRVDCPRCSGRTLWASGDPTPWVCHHCGWDLTLGREEKERLR